MFGNGKKIIFLHGYMSDGRSFYYQTRFFVNAGFSVVVPDLPGFGRSATIEEAWSVGDYADWLKKFISITCGEKPHIIAHSFGARVAFKLLSEGDFADRLVVTGGAGLVKARSAKYRRRVAAYRAVKKFFPSFAERHFGSEEYRALSPVMRQSYKKIVNEDLRDCARAVKSRTLLIYGRDDGVTPASQEGETFRKCIIGSRLEIIDGGHFCFCENADAFNNMVLKFLTEE